MRTILILAMSLITLSLNAQKKATYEKVAETNMKLWIEVCELNEQQKTDLLKVLTEKQKELYAIKKQYKNEPEKRKTLNKEVVIKYSDGIVAAVGIDNAKKMRNYRKNQIGVDMLELMNAKI